MAMSPFALSILGLETMNRRRQTETAEETAVSETARNTPGTRMARTSRRATSHYSSFQTVCSQSHDDPPAYAIATRHKQPVRLDSDVVDETLPKYNCSIGAEAKLLLQLESINPLNGVSESEWREVYVILRGTLLSFHRVKDGGPGKLLKNYTLQHAEIGLASDTQHTVLVPQSRLAHLIPTSARQKAWRRDQDLFRPVRQTVLRLRAETDQILLADASEERIHDLIYAISAGIDISHAIDERSVPRQCTVPRRRRRQRPAISGDMTDPALLAEQERILRDMYPAFAERSAMGLELQRTTTSTSEDAPIGSAQTPTRDEDDLDLAVMREDFAAPGTAAPTQDSGSSRRPAMSRQTTTSSFNSALSIDMIYATSPSNFNTSGKWQPPHPRTAAQIQRYARRCMPVLLAESVRASDVLISNGKRVKINWRMELLEEWDLNPPSYRSHGFKTAADQSTLERSRSTSSQSPSATTNASPQSSRSVVGAGADKIDPIDTSLANLELSKAATATDMGSPTQTMSQRLQSEPKLQEARHPGNEIHGVMFCF